MHKATVRGRISEVPHLVPVHDAATDVQLRSATLWRYLAGNSAMVRRCEAGAAAGGAAYGQSRAFRNTADALNFYALMERRAEITVAFVQGGFDRTPVGEFTYTTLAAAHAMERRMVGQKIKDSYAELNRQGAATGMPPHGYRWAEDRSGWEPDPERADAVRRIFSEYADTSTSARRLAQLLQRGGWAAPSQRGKAAAGEWLPDTVAGILRNPAYAGLKRHSGKLIAAPWEPLVDRQPWQRVQRLVDQRRPPVRNGSEPREHTCPGLLRGPAGGQPMRATPGHGDAY